VKPKKYNTTKAIDANQENLDLNVRFDIIAIHKEGKSFVIEQMLLSF
jgi:putative endonuclease